MVVRAGKLRPSQLVTQFGPGCLIDLPELSMVLAGLDDWDETKSRHIHEPRLQRLLGVDHFRLPPYLDYRAGEGGLPARIFPRFLVCPRCNRLDLHTKFEFQERGHSHICKAGDCRGKGRARAHPVRFMVACPDGHLDDFPWHYWVHPDHPDCTSELRLEILDTTGTITDVTVRCPKHDTRRSLVQAMGAQGQKTLPPCTGNRPWLDDHDPEKCDRHTRVLLRGASNAYFAVGTSALSIPPWSNPIQSDLARYASVLAKVESLDDLEFLLRVGNMPELDDYDIEDIWEALLRHRGVIDETEFDIRFEEYQAFTNASGPISYRSQFKVSPEAVPEAARPLVSSLRKASRLREVRTLRGFTRIDSVPDIGEMGEVEALEAGLAPISRERRNWLPGVDLQGEGIFLTLDSQVLTDWESEPQVQDYARNLARTQAAWYASRALEPTVLRGPKLVLVHSLAHLLIRQLELEAGYSGSSLRERLYCDDKMAGILIYTATPDSDGTLGGLVEQASSNDFGAMFERALQDARLCANDPFCASQTPDEEEKRLNGAACHACLLLPETSCELGNNFLDRSLLVTTLGARGTAIVRG